MVVIVCLWLGMNNGFIGIEVVELLACTVKFVREF